MLKVYYDYPRLQNGVNRSLLGQLDWQLLLQFFYSRECLYSIIPLLFELVFSPVSAFNTHPSLTLTKMHLKLALCIEFQN